VQPDSPFHGIEGLKHMETAIVPGIYDPALADATVRVQTEDAQQMAVRLAREEGLLAGPSGGANVAAALRVASALTASDLVVTVLPDGGERYLSEVWWETNGSR
jgi:cysteine synthase B